MLAARTVPSPCRNICTVRRGLCTGCGRTLPEIERWPFADDAERRRIRADAAQRLKCAGPAQRLKCAGPAQRG
ncbi:DUF1289 domain-containing protein [Sandaracinobacteroides saxicola]|uniref:DUF1289 domain-containing protein n=1 Tax=Sandaracinobacteroides saxicola TaxID=2759707 RepID=A0A7G5IG95_9SPHN|nr:DUF1289 domain-containing protein [Sandaracinobacteroides saxicola]QMW22387.1 DUF1289 domain-containing protein [Sandaracinobacteroides saxicola]